MTIALIVIGILIITNIVILVYCFSLVRRYEEYKAKSNSMFSAIVRNANIASNECASVRSLPRTRGRNMIQRRAIGRIKLHLDMIRADAIYWDGKKNDDGEKGFIARELGKDE